MNLAELKSGMQAEIAETDPSQPGVVRLMVLGLVEGAPVSLRNTAIGGDPMEICVHGTSISVRLEQARHFRLKLLSS